MIPRCQLVRGYYGFGGTYRLHLQDRNLLPWTLRQQIKPKRWYPATGLYKHHRTDLTSSRSAFRGQCRLGDWACLCSFAPSQENTDIAQNSPLPFPLGAGIAQSV
jgi:hypothetical protein